MLHGAVGLEAVGIRWIRLASAPGTRRTSRMWPYGFSLCSWEGLRLRYGLRTTGAGAVTCFDIQVSIAHRDRTPDQFSLHGGGFGSEQTGGGYLYLYLYSLRTPYEVACALLHAARPRARGASNPAVTPRRGQAPKKAAVLFLNRA